MVDRRQVRQPAEEEVGGDDRSDLRVPRGLPRSDRSVRPAATALRIQPAATRPTVSVSLPDAGEYLLLPCWDGVPPTPAQIEQAAQLAADGYQHGDIMVLSHPP